MHISPQSKRREQIVDIFDNYLRGKLAISDAEKTLLQYIKTGECDGYWRGQEGMDEPTTNKKQVCA